MDPLYPAILLLLALPGLWLVRGVRPLARLFACFAMLAVAAAALDLQQPGIASREAHVVVVATAADPELARFATAPGGPGAVVEVREAAPDRLGEELAIAASRAGARTSERVLAWTGPHGRAVPLALASLFDGRTATLPLPFDPAALRVRSGGAVQRDRPATFSLALPGAPVELSLRVRFLGEDGNVELDTTVALVPRQDTALEWRPARAGNHRMECSAAVDGVTVQWAGTVEVAEPAAIAVIEEDGGPTAAALEAQGLRVVRGDAALQQLAECAALVLARPLDPATATTVSAAVQDGLGLVLVGRALAPDNALADLAPVRVLPPSLPPAPAGAGAAGGAGGPPGGDPQAAPPVPAPANVPPQPDREPPAGTPPVPPQPGELPPAGQLPPAKVVPGGPVEVDRRSIAMVLVVDRSGSMSQSDAAGNTRMSYAKTAALRTAEALLEGDRVALVTFGNQDAGVLVLPLTDVTAREVLREGIAKLGAQNESTYLLDGLRIARKQLQESKAAVRHIVVISDGAVVLDERLALAALAGDLAREGCTLSLIQISGDDTSPSQRGFAEDLTRTGGGTYWPVADASRVPVLVSGEVVRALDRVGRRPGGPGAGGSGTDVAKPDRAPPQPPLPEPPKPQPPQPPQPRPVDPVASVPLEVRAVSDSPLLEPRGAPWPRIGRAVAVAGRADAQTLLVVGDAGQPLLALANRGLGRVAALAVEPVGENEGFFADAAFPGRLAQWVTAVQRPVARVEAANLAALAAVEPARPTAAQLATLGIRTGAEFAPWGPPPAVDVPVSRGLAPAWALAGIALLVLVAAVEWWLVRRLP